MESPSSSKFGEIADVDIEFNAEFNAISYNDGETLGTQSFKTDLKGTFTHEIGHLLGLGHTCFNTAENSSDTVRLVDHNGNLQPICKGLGNDDPEVSLPTMYNFQGDGETTKAELHQDDIDGMCAMYPIAQDPNECARPDLVTGCGCSAPGSREIPRSAVFLVFVVAFVLARRKRWS